MRVTFHVISVGRNVARWATGTLDSVHHEWLHDGVEDYGHNPVRLHVVVDGSDDDSAAVVERWFEDHPDIPCSLTVNDERRFATPNQRTALAAADPKDDDIIVWLDLDGDRLLPGALARIGAEYAAGALLTFGTHVCNPPAPGNRPAVPYPPEVVAANSYRQNIMRHGAGFNHPRTMSGAVWRAIPEDHYWFSPRHPRAGEPYDYGADYVFMIPGLELAGPRHAYIPDPILVYNHANPEADYLVSTKQSASVVDDITSRKDALGPLEARRPDGRLLYLPDPERQKIVASYAVQWGLRRFVETGTYRGDTTAFMAERVEQVDTIEADAQLHRAARARFRRTPNVRAHYGDSQKTLKAILKTLREPALFWLDGHQSGPETASLPCPLRAELMQILAHGQRHVILIDDARCLAGQPSHREWLHYADYPSLEWIRAQADIARWDCLLEDDIVRLTPR